MSSMRVVVFGANGKVGTLVVQKLVADGHSVRAFVRSASPSANANIEVFEGDVHNAKQVAAAIKDTDAVVSALGSWGTSSKDILTSAMQAIIPAMQENGVQRIVSLTGSGARDSSDHPSIIDKCNRWAIRLVAGKILQDGESHLALLRNSSLDWTVVRSPAMHGSTKRFGYTLSRKSPLPWAIIAREDVANAMVALIATSEWAKSAPYIRKN